LHLKKVNHLKKGKDRSHEATRPEPGNDKEKARNLLKLVEKNVQHAHYRFTDISLPDCTETAY